MSHRNHSKRIAMAGQRISALDQHLKAFKYANSTGKHGLAYVAINGNKPGERIGLVKFGHTGYYLARGYDFAPHTLEQVRQYVSELNQRLGVSDEVAEAMLFGSMFGWACPAAYPAVAFFGEPKQD